MNVRRLSLPYGKFTASFELVCLGKLITGGTNGIRKVAYLLRAESVIVGRDNMMETVNYVGSYRVKRVVSPFISRRSRESLINIRG